nr:unnamed protein product [Spirometra erinaceieuropaei]
MVDLHSIYCTLSPPHSPPGPSVKTEVRRPGTGRAVQVDDTVEPVPWRSTLRPPVHTANDQIFDQQQQQQQQQQKQQQHPNRGQKDEDDDWAAMPTTCVPSGIASASAAKEPDARELSARIPGCDSMVC